MLSLPGRTRAAKLFVRACDDYNTASVVLTGLDSNLWPDTASQLRAERDHARRRMNRHANKLRSYA